ncbi:LysM peptidoglycan-binding domain-containing protein [Streptomyces sp. ML-6]|uniref:LysM peptidoglycan-binding domain-containing protein n=1 Tax=Streptomyces sp. ML-6 TaxID=2982693 RepID=UPI0024C0295D|nr:LysM peptidoglycan-binding domain-containing protein [Streptomyces sp. ML-6]MDK0524825.1 LysM peptidoglycan-binding domain-containing protein [Streptomyces sp. ML-6]
MAPRIPAPLRAVVTLLRSLLGLALLTVLVGGVPYLLLKVGHQPSELSGGLDLLTQQDDGTLFFVVLTCIGWVAWAAFTVSVLVELVSVLRRRSAPRIKGLGGMQSLASFLIGGIVLLAPTAASAATVAPAVAATATHTIGQDTSSPSVQHEAVQTKKAGLRHTVASATESPWELAERYLGSGPRWKDIAALNPNIPELAAGDQYLPKGAVITLPADARPPAAAAATKAAKALADAQDEAAGSPASYTVRPGDYLSKIADEQLGDGDRWPELYEANKGEKQPYGQVFDDPDRIYPGQELALPAHNQTDPDSESGEKPPAQDDHDTATPPEADTTTPPRPAPDTEPPSAAAPSPGQSRTASPSPAGTPAPDTTTPAPAEPAPSATPADDRRTTTGMRAGMVGLGATGVLAAGLVGTLATRRILQQRRRRRGRRIPMPSGQSALTEIALRSADAGEELAVLDRALRTAAAALAEENRQLPTLTAVQLGTEGVRLHLDAPAPAVAPFTTDPSQSTVWWCPADSGELLPSQESREVDPPYPGLISLGEDDQGAIVLVDLEHTGALHLTGSLRNEVLRTLALTLALSPLAEQLDIAVAGEDTAPELAMLDSDRVTPYPDLADAVHALQAHHAEQQQALDRLGGGEEAGAGGLWPLVVVADLDSCPAPEGAREVLWEVLGQQPRPAVAVVTSSTAVPEEAGGAWPVDTDLPYITVPGTTLHVALSVCSDAEYADILDVALTADAPGDVPAPVPEPAASAPSAENQQPASVLPSQPGVSAAGEAAGPVGKPGLMAAFAELEDDTDDDVDDAEDPADPTAGQESTPGPEPLPTSSPSPGAPVLPALSSPPLRVSSRIPDPAGSEETEPARPAAVPLPEQPVPSCPSDSPDRPLVRVLGTVDLLGARGTVKSNRRTLALEMTAWLVLHPGANHHQLDEVLAPGGIVTRNTRNTRLGDVRRWLGADTQGNKHFPHVSTQPDKLYRLAKVDCDWDRFQELARSGRTTDGPDGEQLLRQALELVHGRPFSGIPSRRYAWAESLTQEMIAEIVDAADDLAERYLARGDARSALWAATHGLTVAREMECLWRHKFRALSLLGEEAALETSIRQLDELLLELGSSMDEETEQVLRLL